MGRRGARTDGARRRARRAWGRAPWAALVVAGSAVACDLEDAPVAGPIARYALVEDGPPPWGDVPFPNDLYRVADGLGPIPVPARGEAWTAAAEALGRRDGFCVTCAVYFPIEGELDRSSLPVARTAAEAGDPTDSVLLFDADEASPDYGRLLPLRTEWIPAFGLVALRPARGVVLARRRVYAAIATRRLRDADGAALRAAPVVRDALDPASAHDSSPAAVRVAAALAPVRRLLERHGIDATEVASATVFTTGDPTRHLVGVRELVHAAPVPSVTVDAVWSAEDGSLDAVLGTPLESRPGMDVPSVPGSVGPRAVDHASVALAIAGHFFAPRVVTGEGLDPGVPRVDDAGSPVSGPLGAVPFLLILPKHTPLAPLPVVVFHTGVGETRASGFLGAETAAEAGLALLSLEPPLHGVRAASGADLRHDLRGDDGTLGPDGLHEHDPIDVIAHWLGLAGAAPGLEAYPGYALGAITQQVSDVLAAVRLVREGDWSQVRSADAMLTGLELDRDRILFLGVSNGAMTASDLLVVEPDVRAAVLNVSPGALTEVLCEGPSFRVLTDLAIAPALAIRGAFDEVTRTLCFDPRMDFYRWVVEPVEPLALAPHLFRDPVRAGEAPHVLWQLAGHDETVPPPTTESTLAAAGVPGVPGRGRFEFAPIEARAAPVRGNLALAEGPVTAVGARFPDATHLMIGKNVDLVAYDAPIVPPFHRRATPVEEVQPIEAVHRQLARFFRSYLEDGTPTVE